MELVSANQNRSHPDKMPYYWNTHTHEEIINFVKTHENFIEDKWNEEDINTIICETFEDWCDRVYETKGLPKSSLVRKYFNFEQMLRDGWRNGCKANRLQYYLVGRDDNTLYLLDEAVRECGDAELSWCWVVAVFG
jgi:hypothetical protein